MRVILGVIATGCVAHTIAATDLTLSDAQLSATFSSEPTTLGLLTDLRSVGKSNVVAAPTDKQSVWTASFLGTGVGTTSFDSAAAATKCNSTAAVITSKTSLKFTWTDCEVQVPTVPSPSPTPKPATWVLHNNSNCAGACVPEHSSGPHGGNCDRLPGCGHDAGLPFCDVEAMKARCLNLTECTEFNTNGYLYTGSVEAVPFSGYPLQCWSLQGAVHQSIVSVCLDVSLDAGQLSYDLSFSGDGTLSLWDYTLSLPNVQTTQNSQPAFSTAAKQLRGIYDASVSAITAGGNAVYFSAHDPKSVVKQCSATASTPTGSMSCTVDSLNATIPLHDYVATFPMVATVVSGDWWDLAQVYRAWVLQNAEWTSLGSLEHRAKSLPPWLENITLWMSNNWGGDPLGPNYGGDPEHVKLEMLAVNEVLDLPSHGGHLALHWYEWDTLGYELGSNHTKCGSVGKPCGFDTNYPNYFPARVACKESIKAMQDAGMRVIPYINGQLFDTRIPRYTDDKALLAVQKFAAKSMNATLTPHLEHFDGITSAVVCPHTDYWHGVMRDTVVEIVNELGFDGCYVDQVGNGELRNCADPTHNHSIHGGSFWAEAFYGIMQDVRASIPPQSGMFMTEGTVEEVSGPGFDILLGLQWTEEPYWSAIYGGYGYATGRAGSISKPLNGGLCTELTQQFMVGGTMGWFTYQVSA